MSDSFDESQDWPLRDYSSRLRPPRQPDETAGAEQLPEPDPEPQPEPPPSSAGVEVLYDEDEVDAGAPEAQQAEADEQPPVETPQASVETPEVETPEPEPEAPAEDLAEPVDPGPTTESAATGDEHAEGDLRIPDGISVLEGTPTGQRRTAAIVVSKFNGEITGKLLDSAMGALEEAGVARDAVLVMPVPGAFELPIAAMALAKTRRYSCVIALGCVIRGETPHFDFVAGEAASGLQLAGIETGVPVSFGLLTCDTAEQAEERVDRGAWAARAALEMADAFSQLRTAVAGG
jgi:6,7-dimethyl-8-ribityllumazine synthase